MSTIDHSHLHFHPLLALLLASAPLGCDATDEPVAQLDAFESPTPIGTLVDESRTVAQLPGFDLDITADEGDVVVMWASQGGGGATFTVWRGSEPYFEPGDPDSVVLAQGVADTIFVDPDADANDEPYYYRVVVEDGSGAISTTVGKYVHSVRTGYNKISQPLISDVIDASALAEDLPQMWSAVLWDPAAQAWSGWYIEGDFSPFGIGLGDVPVVLPMWGTDTAYHQYGIVPDVDELQTTLLTGDNIVTVPLSYGDTTAAELVATVPGVTQVGQWDNVAQETLWFGVNGGLDFEVPAGSAVHLVVTAETVWPGS